MLFRTEGLKPNSFRAEKEVEGRETLTPDREREKQEPQHLFQEGEKAKSSFPKKGWLRTSIHSRDQVLPYTLYGGIKNYY